MTRVSARRGLTLIELLLAVMLMGLVSMALSQTFSVGIDAYRRGRMHLRIAGQARVASHALVEAGRSMHPQPGKIKLESRARGSSLNLIRRGRAGLEENGFALASDKGKFNLQFRRQWPVESDVTKGGVTFPLMRDVSEFSMVLRRPDKRVVDAWPSGAKSDTVPRLLEFKLRRSDGVFFESAAFARVDPEVITLAADTGSDT